MFFFSSRRRHTRSKRDWSSDVCSSDLEPIQWGRGQHAGKGNPESTSIESHFGGVTAYRPEENRIKEMADQRVAQGDRSEERRVGKEGREGRRERYKKKKQMMV